jgi:hypothetical protein
MHEDGIGKHQSQKAWDIGESVWCRNCNLVSLDVFAGHLRKREITLAIICIILACILQAPHNLHNLIHIVKPKNTPRIPSFLVVGVHWMVWVFSGHREPYFLSFHVKFDIFNFSLKLHSMTNNGSLLSGQ